MKAIVKEYDAFISYRHCELDSFVAEQLHKRDHVLAVLAEGEPDESFPELLLREEIKEIGADGVERVSYREVEPLAADVRGKSKKESAKNIKKEVL